MVYHALLGGILSLAVILVEALIVGKFRFYTGRQYLILAATALMDAIACFSMTVAYQKDSSGFISLLGYSTIVYAFLADIFVIPQTIYPLEYAGTFIILIVTITIAAVKLIQLRRERNVNQTQADEELEEIEKDNDGKQNKPKRQKPKFVTQMTATTLWERR